MVSASAIIGNALAGFPSIRKQRRGVARTTKSVMRACAADAFLCFDAHPL